MPLSNCDLYPPPHLPCPQLRDSLYLQESFLSSSSLYLSVPYFWWALNSQILINPSISLSFKVNSFKHPNQIPPRGSKVRTHLSTTMTGPGNQREASFIESQVLGKASSSSVAVYIVVTSKLQKHLKHYNDRTQGL